MKKIGRKLLFLSVLLLTLVGYSQTVNISSTNGTCTSNGRITVNVSGIQVNDNITITISKQGGGTPIVESIIAADTFSNKVIDILGSGDYTVDVRVKGKDFTKIVTIESENKKIEVVAEEKIRRFRR